MATRLWALCNFSKSTALDVIVVTGVLASCLYSSSLHKLSIPQCTSCSYHSISGNMYSMHQAHSEEDFDIIIIIDQRSLQECEQVFCFLMYIF